MRFAKLILGAPITGIALSCACQDTVVSNAPKIRLMLPRAEGDGVGHVSYFMSGPFGGYGWSEDLKDSQSAYEFAAAVESSVATRVKVIVYVPGCEIERLELEVQGASQSHDLKCISLRRVALRGQISPLSVIRDRRTDIVVDYVASWDHDFFGIADGMVNVIRLGRVEPDQNGSFQVLIPDFAVQNLGDGELVFRLRGKDDEFAAELQPNGNDALKVSDSYPAVISFVVRQ